MVIIICIFLLLVFLFIKAISSSSARPTVKPVVKNYQAIEAAVVISKAKASVEDVLEQAQSKEAVYYWADIDHLTDQEIISIASQLNKTQLRRWFNYHHKEYFHFPDKAYAFIQAKLLDQVWFTDDEYAAREAEGKRSTYFTENDLLIERFEEIFYNNEMLFANKMARIDELLGKKSNKIRLGNKLSLFNIAYDHVKTLSLDEESLKTLKSIKNRQTRAFNKLELTEADIDFKTLDEYLRK